MKKNLLFRALTALMCLLLAVSLSGTLIAFQFATTVNNALNTPPTKLVSDGEEGEKVVYASSYDSEEELQAVMADTAATIGEEGVVLLKNENQALPLRGDARVSFFGIGAENILVSGTGSGSGSSTMTADGLDSADLKSALEACGIEVNAELYDWYKANTKEDYRGTFPTVKSSDTSGVRVDEIDINTVDLSSVEPTDIGIFVVTRNGGEGADAVAETVEGMDFEHYLELNDTEKEVLKKMKEMTSTQIVIINSNSAVGLSFLDAEEYGVDACVWMPGTGDAGISGVAATLTNQDGANFSDRLVDTWATYSLSAPACQNLTAVQWSNWQDVMSQTGSADFSSGNFDCLWNDAYVVEQEGIYIGYKYYETRYEDAVLGQGNATSTAGAFVDTTAWNYDQEVSRPFGFGLSYTTFEQKLLGVTESVEEDTGEPCYLVSVQVTNTGSYAGKDVVQVYFQSPYTDYDRQNGVEKSAIVLGGFQKTQTLEPGQSETVEVKVLKRDIASYDENNAKTYIFEAGTYYLAVGSDAHDAINNILAVKGAQTAGDPAKVCKMDLAADNSFATSETGAAITNQFDDADLSYFGYESRYLSRSDWAATWPKEEVLTANEQTIASLARANYTPSSDQADEIAAKYPDYLEGNGGSLALVSMRGKSLDDPQWEEILNQMSLEELITLNTNGYPGTAEVLSIGKPGNTAMDGPSGHKDRFTFPVQVMLGATWNQELAEQYGTLLAEDGFFAEKQGILGPGANIHRTPYAGRNFEYYSEDAIFAGIMLENEIRGYLNVGGEMYVKHFALNDQEDHRFGVSMFASEQAIRETYLRAFEYAFTRGNCNAVMTSFNRIGTTYSGADTGLIQGVLRGEWGFTGIITSDNAVTTCGYIDPISAKIVGTTTWRNGFNSMIRPYYDEYAGTDLGLYEAMRECAKYVLYTSANDINMNGLSENVHVVSVTPWWQTATVAVTLILTALTLLSLAGVVITQKKK